MSITPTLERMARAAPPPVARLAKRVAVHPRYWLQRRRAGRAFRRHAERYPHRILFVAGLPKSGTTWLERMICGFPGFHEVLIPEVARYELATGGSHDYELPEDMFGRFRGRLVLSKMHVHGSAHNVEVLRRAGVRYVVLYRDLRDVAVSYYFYVHRTPWHPEHPVYRSLDAAEGLEQFARTTLPAYMRWVRSWHANRDPAASIEIRYEQMIRDAAGTLRQVTDLFQLEASPALVDEIVARHSFQRLSGGRAPGHDKAGSFFRKGVAGDWKNHLTPQLRELYRGVLGDFLIEFGYETGPDW
jgi:hypothetical protein